MSDIDNDTSDLPVVDELTALKARADQIGLKYHPNIGLETLREKVNAALSAPGPVEQPKVDEAEDYPAPEDPALLNQPAANAAPESLDAPVTETLSQRRLRKKREANELIRIRVTCMNPAKKEWEGELFTAGNSVVGSFSKFVPFNIDEGWHVPRIIYNQIVQRQFQTFRNEKTKNGVTVRRSGLIREFAIEVLPQLSLDELQELAQRQAMAKTID
jgi:hypothetical protein